MSGIISCSFGLNLTLLRFVGLYPSTKHPVLHKVYAVSLFVLSQTFPLVFGSLHFVFAEDLTAINYTDHILLGVIFYTFKLLPFLKNGGEIKRCVEYFDDYVVTSSDERLIVDKCVSTCKRNSLVFIGGCVMFSLGLIWKALLEANMDKLPLNIWLPKEWEETPLIHRSVYFVLIYVIAYVVISNGTIDPLIGGLSHHASAQLQILGHYLQFLDQKVHLSNEGMVYKKIKMCIRHYQYVVTFVHKYQECFSPVVFSQFMSSVLVIGLCCFQLIVMKVDVDFFVTVLGLGLLFFQIFVYCYYGTLLMEENESLFRAIYMSKWYEYDKQSKRALLTLMERLKKPLVVTAGRILALSLETFTVILKRAYSFSAVLRNY